MAENEDRLSRVDALEWAYEQFGIANGFELIELARYIRNEEI